MYHTISPYEAIFYLNTVFWCCRVLSFDHIKDGYLAFSLFSILFIMFDNFQGHRLLIFGLWENYFFYNHNTWRLIQRSPLQDFRQVNSDTWYDHLFQRDIVLFDWDYWLLPCWIFYFYNFVHNNKLLKMQEFLQFSNP